MSQLASPAFRITESTLNEPSAEGEEVAHLRYKLCHMRCCTLSNVSCWYSGIGSSSKNIVSKEMSILLMTLVRRVHLPNTLRGAFSAIKRKESIINTFTANPHQANRKQAVAIFPERRLARTLVTKADMQTVY